jgi:hypothetical protein
MRSLKFVLLLGLGLLIAQGARAAQIGIGVQVGPGYVGPAPVCPYGYYDYYPYACAPYGYYGPEWFSGGVFIGVGPWGHGWWHGRYYGGHGYAGRAYAHGYGHGYAGRAYANGYGHGYSAGHANGRVTTRSGNAFRGGTNSFHGGGGSHGGGRRR